MFKNTNMDILINNARLRKMGKSYVLKCVQLVRERLSYRSVEAYPTMLKDHPAKGFVHRYLCFSAMETINICLGALEKENSNLVPRTFSAFQI